MVTDTDAILGVAASHLPVREAGANTGRFVEAIIAFAGGKAGDPWCAAWVYYVGRHALKKRWTVPRTLSCDVILEYATTYNLLSEVPVVGGLFLVLNPKNLADAKHVGFVETLVPRRGPNAFASLEGNSNDMGSVEGIGVFRNVRAYIDGPKPDARIYRYVDWARLLT